jgi:hypothetical protein
MNVQANPNNQDRVRAIVTEELEEMPDYETPQTLETLAKLGDFDYTIYQNAFNEIVAEKGYQLESRNPC